MPIVNEIGTVLKRHCRVNCPDDAKEIRHYFLSIYKPQLQAGSDDLQRFGMVEFWIGIGRMAKGERVSREDEKARRKGRRRFSVRSLSQAFRAFASSREIADPLKAQGGVKGQVSSAFFVSTTPSAQKIAWLTDLRVIPSGGFRMMRATTLELWD
jgi:hypothetical protein